MKDEIKILTIVITESVMNVQANALGRWTFWKIYNVFDPLEAVILNSNSIKENPNFTLTIPSFR